MRIPDAVELILFDLDGLLVDTERLHWQAYRQMCQTFGQTLTWDYLTYLEVAGGSAGGICERMRREIPGLFQGREWEELYEVKRESLYEILATSPIPLMPGAEHCLRLLAGTGKPLVVVTHSPRKFVDMVRAAHPVFSLINEWISREMYGAPKPAPDGYLKACSDLRIAPERAIGFEDTVRGIESLLAARIQAVLVNATDQSAHRACEGKGVTIIESLGDVQG